MLKTNILQKSLHQTTRGSALFAIIMSMLSAEQGFLQPWRKEVCLGLSEERETVGFDDLR